MTFAIIDDVQQGYAQYIGHPVCGTKYLPQPQRHRWQLGTDATGSPTATDGATTVNLMEFMGLVPPTWLKGLLGAQQSGGQMPAPPQSAHFAMTPMGTALSGHMLSMTMPNHQGAMAGGCMMGNNPSGGMASHGMVFPGAMSPGMMTAGPGMTMQNPGMMGSYPTTMLPHGISSDRFVQFRSVHPPSGKHLRFPCAPIHYQRVSTSTSRGKRFCEIVSDHTGGQPNSGNTS